MTTATKTDRNSEAYNTGYEARVQEEPRKANPYPTGSWDSDNWLAGWDHADEVESPVA